MEIDHATINHAVKCKVNLQKAEMIYTDCHKDADSRIKSA